MNILAINTSSTSGSIAIAKDDKIVFVTYLDVRITHSERLLPQIDFGLKQSRLQIKDMDAITIANGPGSFTGIRIGLATAKGLSYAHKIPLIPFNSLLCLAYNVYGTERDILVLNDAKMNEIYSALYSPDFKEIIAPQNSTPIPFLQNINSPVFVLGDGIKKYQKEIIENVDDIIFAKSHQNLGLAINLISLVQNLQNIPDFDFDFVSNLEPNYLRKSQAELLKDQGEKNGK